MKERTVQDVRYEHAIALANAGRHDEALQVADQLWAAHPEVVDYAALRAQIQSDRGDVAAALAALDEAMARLPELPLAPMHRWASRGALVHMYGTLLMRDGRDTEAQPWLHEAARRNGLATGEWAAHFYAGFVAFRLNDFALAGRYWHDLLYRAPDLGASDILPLVQDYVARSDAAELLGEPLLRICLGRIALDSPELLDLTPAQGDALAAAQAERVLAEQPDHPEARRLRAPLRLGSEPAAALDDLETYLRQRPDPLAQVRALTWRHQANVTAGANAPAQPAWTGFAVTADADDGALYFHAATALGSFLDEVPASQAALKTTLEAMCRKGLSCFESYFETGEGDAQGHGGNADPHLYSLLCRLLGRTLPADAAHLDEKVALHRKGMAASDFIDHWIDLLDTYAAAGQHQQVVDMAGEVLNRYPVERNPAGVSWAFSRLVAAWAAIGGREATESASAALAHMDARLDALPVEARTEGAHAMAHARAHYGALLQTGMASMDEHDKADAIAELEALQRRSLLIEDAWVSGRFGQIWRDLGDNERAMPLLEQAVQLGEGDARQQALARVQRARLLVDLGRHPEALTDFQIAFAARDDWDAQTWLAAVQAALGMGQRETALGWFERARGLDAEKGVTRGLFAKVETALKATRPKWKLWGV
ncbi:tetratricopeptide repeat protein [Cupriavidus sp. U2]|uniref:tetratricopeptide repeat protein n=1 Tax=Cupriavidus sp. U2 TaxID=2920269 RepID=UPI00129E28CD|nr:tetratricopeptide repeat protein [Cupriavidus sp. U2]